MKWLGVRSVSLYCKKRLRSFNANYRTPNVLYCIWYPFVYLWSNIEFTYHAKYSLYIQYHTQPLSSNLSNENL